MEEILTKNSALIVVDMQNDFINGALAVPNADTIIPIVNEYIKLFEKNNLMIVFTRDWHPENHCSFKENGGIWPKHCVQNTYGAEFHKDLYMPTNKYIISKAFLPDLEAYSAFEKTELDDLLKKNNIDTVFVCGLATDYCVKQTVLSALKLGYKTYLLVDAIKGVDLNNFDSEKAINEMIANKAKVVVFDELLNKMKI
ncbi:MAG: bifunctional nicotinamidase/pyrazinamidase [bacterium]|nr:bifunctional nicotinamidase/pyrazinamidase [bacterium]